MDLEEAREFVREHHRAIFCTYRRDGTAQLSPVLAAIDEHGYLEISSNEPRAKVRNLRRDPRASVLVMTEKFFERRWIQLDGPAEIVPWPDAEPGLLGHEERTGGERPADLDAWQEEQRDAQAVLIRIAIERAGPSPRPSRSA